MGSIRVTQLGKAYRQYARRWSRLAEWVWPFGGVRHSLKWVLREVEFAIAPGEAVGLIGVNGAGKSTLLKLITGTTTATTGSIAVNGRVAALLELGMGFHPDFTGRQNVLIAGQLQGLSVEEVAGLMPQIEAFAEIGSYIDQPVRVYSSGMQMRLAFSVATCVRPDILIVDEALAVGDVFFQQKCFDRIRAFTAAGTTLLFVSHSAATIMGICSRCLLLRQGALAFDGLPKEAIDLYQADLLGSGNAVAQSVVTHGISPPTANTSLNAHDWDDLAGALPLRGRTGSIVTNLADCLIARLVNRDGGTINAVWAEQEVRLKVAFRLHQERHDPHVGFKIRDRFGTVMFETNSYCMKQRLGTVGAGVVLAVEFVFAMNLSPGDYTVTVGLSNDGHGEGSFTEILSYLHEVMAFAVVANPEAITWAGVANLNPELCFRQINAAGGQHSTRA